MVSTLIEQIAKTWMHTYKTDQNKSLRSRVKEERGKKKEFMSGVKHTSKQAYALIYKGLDRPTQRVGQTKQCPGEQGSQNLYGPDCPIASEMKRSDK